VQRHYHAIIIIAIEIAFSIETIVTIELIMVSITVITLGLGIMSIFANKIVHAIEMSINCRGCWGIRGAQWQGELDGPDVTGRDVSWEMTEKRLDDIAVCVSTAMLPIIVSVAIITRSHLSIILICVLPLHVGFPAQCI